MSTIDPSEAKSPGVTERDDAPDAHEASFEHIGGDIYEASFGQAPSDQEIERYVKLVADWYTKLDHDVAFLVNLAAVAKTTPIQRKRIADLHKQVQNIDRKYMRACAIVAPNTFTRGIATAVYWLCPPVYPYRFFDDRASALAWAKQMLAAARPANES
jgi:hypothetical protein